MANSDTVVDSSSRELIHSPLLMPEEPTVPGCVDYKHRPAVRSKRGRWGSASFIIGVEVAERFAYYGISSNLINFLTEELGQSTAMAAANVNAWSGVSALLTILGAVIADSFLGKYYTIIASSLLYILGLGVLSLSAILPSLSCSNSERSISSTFDCSPHSQIITFFLALYLVALAQGGHKPCVQAFGADQFDGKDPQETKAKSSFFNWWYFWLSTGNILGISVLSYVQDSLSWGLGFGIPCFVMLIALVTFVLGTVTYRYVMKSKGQSPFMRIGRVFVAAARNWRAVDSTVSAEEEAQGTLPHKSVRQFKFLNKALLGPDISKGDGETSSISEVEEAKGVLRLFPIWATCLIFAIVFSQQSTFFTKQGVTLNRSIGSSFTVPSASLQSFVGVFIIIFIPIYDRVLVPIARALAGKPAGISTLERIGTGLFISIITMVVAALVEKKRLEIASEYGLIDLPNLTLPMRIWWLVPQYALFGIAEVFTMVGLQEFFYDQVPDELRSVGLSLYLSIFGIGNLLSCFLVSLIDNVTSRRGQSWFSNNLNRAHLDYFYWLLAALSAIVSVLFAFFAKSYIYKENARG